MEDIVTERWKEAAEKVFLDLANSKDTTAQVEVMTAALQAAYDEGISDS